MLFTQILPWTINFANVIGPALRTIADYVTCKRTVEIIVNFQFKEITEECLLFI